MKTTKQCHTDTIMTVKCELLIKTDSWTSEGQILFVNSALSVIPVLSLSVSRIERENTGKPGRGGSTH